MSFFKVTFIYRLQINNNYIVNIFDKLVNIVNYLMCKNFKKKNKQTEIAREHICIMLIYFYFVKLRSQI